MEELLTCILLFLLVGTMNAQVEHTYRTIRIRGLLVGVDINSLIQTNSFQGFPVHYQGAQVLDHIPELNDFPKPGMSILGRCHRDANKEKQVYEATIYLKKEIFYDPLVAEVVLAHELGHLLGLKHGEKFSIMQPIAITQPGDDYDVMYKDNQAIWDQFFNQLKNEY